ncbi:MAG: endonuclease domain-containing protein [Candidatus Omnitrophica bacterium]|nr:endonuclease domain-containing protein [Candidatus Omnitrophota bacterium]
MKNRGMRNKASPQKKAFAKYLRRNQTHPEMDLGKALDHTFPNVPIYRQSLSYGYILDFYVAANKEGSPYRGIAIEVDGPCHLARKEYDKHRDAVLWSKGIRTLRFDIAAIRNNMKVVLSIIYCELTKIRK